MSLQSQEIVGFQLTEKAKSCVPKPSPELHLRLPRVGAAILSLGNSFGNSGSEMSRFRMQIVDGKCLIHLRDKGMPEGK
jgi:hypothetical protein